MRYWQLGLINRRENFCYYFEYDPSQGGIPVAKVLETPSQFYYRDWRDGWEHWYCEVKTSDVFKEFDLTEYIPEDVFQKILDPDSNFVLHICNSHEGFLDMPREVYTHVVEKYNIPAHKIILSNGAVDLVIEADRVCDERNSPTKFKVELVLDFERGQLDDQNMPGKKVVKYETLVPENIRKSYLCFNRRWRFHRPLMISALYGKGILDKGYVSFGPSDCGRNWGEHVPEYQADGITKNENPNEGGVFGWIRYFCDQNKDLYDLIIPHAEHLTKLEPMYLDTDDLVTNRARFTWRPGWLYAQSLVSVVNETNYFKQWHADDTKESSIFLSEKIFKPIAFGHPFIVASTPKFLNALKSIGYKTFSPLIDESYDNEQCDYKRMVMIVNEIERICNFTQEEIVDFCNKARPIVEHNKQVLESRKSFNYKMNY